MEATYHPAALGHNPQHFVHDYIYLQLVKKINSGSELTIFHVNLIKNDISV